MMRWFDPSPRRACPSPESTLRMNTLLLNLRTGCGWDPMHTALLLDSLARAFASISPSWQLTRAPSFRPV